MNDKKDAYNLSSGLLTSLNLDNFLALRTGVLFDIKKYSVYEYDIYYANSPFEEKRNEKYFEFQYLRVPTTVNFYFIKRNPFLLYTSIGIVFGIPLYNDSGFVNYRTTDYSGKFNYIFHFGFGLKYTLNERINIMIEPLFNRFIYPIIQEYTMRECSPSPYPCGPGYYSNITKHIDSVNSRNYIGTYIIINFNIKK